jgi:hypothetical protein
MNGLAVVVELGGSRRERRAPAILASCSSRDSDSSEVACRADGADNLAEANEQHRPLASKPVGDPVPSTEARGAIGARRESSELTGSTCS